MTDTLSTNGRTRLQANRRDGQVWSALPGGCERSESDGASRPYLYRCFASPPTPVHPAPHSGSERRSPILNRRSRPGAQAASSSVVGSALLYAPERRQEKNAPEGAGLETVGLETVARPLGAKCGRQATPKRETGEGSITPAPSPLLDLLSATPALNLASIEEPRFSALRNAPNIVRCYKRNRVRGGRLP